MMDCHASLWRDDSQARARLGTILASHAMWTVLNLAFGNIGNSSGEHERFCVRTGVCSNNQAICAASVDVRTRIQADRCSPSVSGEPFHDSEKAEYPRA